MEKITIKEVASLSGVSPRTVSRVVNKDPNVKASTREKVKKVIEETGYEVNFLAKSLRDKKTKTLIAFIDQHKGEYWGAFHNQMIQELMREAHRRNYRLVISSSSAESYKEDDNDGFYLLKSGFADGAIMFDIKPDDMRIKYLNNYKIPFVIIGKDNDHFDTSYVDLDNVSVGYTGAKYLTEHGKKSIYFLLGDEGYVVNQERSEGFRRYFEKSVQDDSYGKVIQNVMSIEDAYMKALEILQNVENRPDAFFVSGDERAMGVYRAIYEQGLTIPNDIGVLGIDNIMMGEFYFPPITTIDQSITSIVLYTFEILMQQLSAKNEDGKRMLITPHIVERRSV